MEHRFSLTYRGVLEEGKRHRSDSVQIAAIVGLLDSSLLGGKLETERLFHDVCGECDVIAGLRALGKETETFTSVRGKGSLIAVTTPSPEHRAAMLGALMDAAVIALPCGTRSVRFRLPLVMTIEESDELLSRTRMAVSTLASAV